MKHEILEVLVKNSEVVEIESDTVPFNHNLGHEVKEGTTITLR